jgi:translin
MEKLETIGDEIRGHWDDKNSARDGALQQSRTLVRYCSKSIRATHRDERAEAKSLLDEAKEIVTSLRESLESYPDLYHAGYTQSALKEFAEATIVYRLVGGEPLPHPDELNIGDAPYMGGLAETAGELRRRALDLMRRENFAEAERQLGNMDNIYSLLVTMDFPDAITGNLRRTTDMVRGVTERTRGDLTTSFRQHELIKALEAVEKKLDHE